MDFSYDGIRSGGARGCQGQSQGYKSHPRFEKGKAKFTDRSRLSKKIAVRACSLEPDVIAFDRVVQHPIRFDVAVPAPSELAAQRMILVVAWQRLSLHEQLKDSSQFAKVLATPLHPFHVSLELAAGAERPHKPMSA